MDVQVGQYWRENNPRIKGARIIEVIAIREDLVRVRTVVQKIGPSPNRGYVTWTSITRFNNKSGGFTYLPAGIEQ